MAHLDDTHGQPEASYQWLTKFAREGDVFAMPVLIENGSETQVRARLWMHLSSILDRDLSQYRYEAISEGGTPCDHTALAVAFEVTHLVSEPALRETLPTQFARAPANGRSQSRNVGNLAPKKVG